MSKKELMKEIADWAGITEIQAEKSLDFYFRIIEKRPKETGRVVISNFGTFLVENSGEKKSVSFRASKKLRDSL